MKLIGGILLLIVLSFWGLFSTEGAEIIRIGASDYPPYQIEKPENGRRGFDVELVEEVFQRIGIHAKIEFYPRTRAIRMAQDGELTAILSISDDSQREKFFILSDPISTWSYINLVRKDYAGEALTSWEKLRGMNVGTMKDYITSHTLTQLGISHDLSSTTQIGLKKLADKRIDVLVTSLENTLYLIGQTGISAQFKWFVFDKKRFHIGFSKKYQKAEQLVIRFNQVLESVKKDGVYDAIHNKYQ